MQLGRRCGIKDRFDHEDELCPALPAVDDWWCVFGVRRDIAHIYDERIAPSIHCHPHDVAVMDVADLTLRHERAHLDILRRQKHYYRFARRHPFTLPVKCVVNEAGLWG